MNAAVETPQSVDGWIAFLKDKPLSVRNSIQMKVRKKLRSDTTTLADLSQLVRLDPVLALAIVRKAAEMHHAKGSEVTGIDHAVNSLGMDNIELAMDNVPAMKLNPTSVAQKMYFRAIANSHHAATQAFYLCQRRNAMFAEETYLAALFYGVGHWALWMHAPLHMSKIQIKIREEGVDTVLAETDVLGCTIQALSKALVETWGLSPLAAESLDHEKSPSRQELANLNLRAVDDTQLSPEIARATNHLAQQKFFPVKLANWLALTTPLGWTHPKTLRIVEVFNDFLRDELDNTSAILHENCANSSRQYHVPGTLTPAAEMLLLPSNLKGHYKLSPREERQYLKTSAEPIKPFEAPVVSALQPSSIADNSTQTATSTTATGTTSTGSETSSTAHNPELRRTPPSATFANQKLYAQIAQRFLKGFDGYTEPRQIIQALLNALYHGLGMQHVIFHRVQPGKMQMQASLSLGLPEGYPLSQLHYTLDVPSLFKRLAEKSSCIWVTTANRTEMIRMLPDSYQPLVGDGGAMLMSLFLDNKPVGIVHIDSPSNGANMVSFHHERFRYLCSAAVLALKRITGKS
ncbi:MAG: HDOD domain-containing protein [Marinobacterium sp.]|nr:HDOD domain-containing protein [Marinobacterium sp.]